MEVYDIPPNEQLLLLDGIDLTMLDQSLLLHKMLDEKDFVRLEVWRNVTRCSVTEFTCEKIQMLNSYV